MVDKSAGWDGMEYVHMQVLQAQRWSSALQLLRRPELVLPDTAQPPVRRVLLAERGTRQEEMQVRVTLRLSQCKLVSTAVASH